MASTIIQIGAAEVRFGPKPVAPAELDPLTLTDYSCQVTAAAINTSSNTTTTAVPATFCGPASENSVPVASSFTLDLDFLQDWTVAAGLSAFLFANDATEQAFALYLVGADDPVATGIIIAQAGAFGGTPGEALVASVSLAIQGYPVINDPLGVPIRSATTTTTARTTTDGSPTTTVVDEDAKSTKTKAKENSFGLTPVPVGPVYLGAGPAEHLEPRGGVMSTRVIRNMDEYKAKLVVYANKTRGAQRLAVARSTDRVNRALDAAAVRLAGSDRVLSGVGKNGARLHHTSTRPIDTATEMMAVFRKEGPWQIRDNSRTGGDTQVRVSTPHLRKSPRPMAPGQKWMPSLKDRTGHFYSNFNTDRAGENIIVVLEAGPRIPAWRNAIQAVQPTILDLHRDAFDKAGAEAFG